jgi:DNA-binding PadR family transcriptional regulator
MMSKPKLVVLGFINYAPMYGYQIGHIVEQFGLPVWAGIKLPSIYKALQELEASKHISGKQVTEGNNPPRTVFSINDKGRKLLGELVRQSLVSPKTLSQDWWLAMSFASQTMTRDFMERVVRERLERLKAKDMKAGENKFHAMAEARQLPFVHAHLMNMGMRHHKVEEQALEELLNDLAVNAHEDFFLKGE